MKKRILSLFLFLGMAAPVWVYAFEHIDETIATIYKHYNTLHKSKDALQYEAKILKEMSAYEKNRLGMLDLDKVRGIGVAFNLVEEENNPLDILDGFIYKVN